jgi:hypothetical protein
MRLAPCATLLPVLLLGACPGQTVKPPPGPSINGRVVDIETCLTANGCQGVAGVRVALFQNSRVISEVTTPDGGFALRDVPVGVRDYLLVSDATGSGEFLSVLQAAPVSSTGADLFGLELYAMKRVGGLYAAFEQEAAVEVSRDALFFGQVYVVEGGGMKAVLGAAAASNPAGKVRYVDCNPRIKGPMPCAKALFDSTRTTTGPFGEFLVIAPGKGNLMVKVSAPDQSFPIQQAPVSPGYLTIGLHKGSGKLTDGGVSNERGVPPAP